MAAPALRGPGAGDGEDRVREGVHRSQNDDSQVDEFNACGCEKIFIDTASGKNAARPTRPGARLSGGVMFAVTRLSRAMRSRSTFWRLRQ